MSLLSFATGLPHAGAVNPVAVSLIPLVVESRRHRTDAAHRRKDRTA